MIIKAFFALLVLYKIKTILNGESNKISYISSSVNFTEQLKNTVPNR